MCRSAKTSEFNGRRLINKPTISCTFTALRTFQGFGFPYKSLGRMARIREYRCCHKNRDWAPTTSSLGEEVAGVANSILSKVAASHDHNQQFLNFLDEEAPV